MIKVGQILMTTCRTLVLLEILKADDADVDAAERRGDPARVTLVELDAGDAGQQFNAKWRSAEPNYLIGAKEEVGRQFRHVEAERSKRCDELGGCVESHRHPDIDVRGGTWV